MKIQIIESTAFNLFSGKPTVTLAQCDHYACSVAFAANRAAPKTSFAA
jgi:hypothetical protein